MKKKIKVIIAIFFICILLLIAFHFSNRDALWYRDALNKMNRWVFETNQQTLQPKPSNEIKIVNDEEINQRTLQPKPSNEIKIVNDDEVNQRTLQSKTPNEIKIVNDDEVKSTDVGFDEGRNVNGRSVNDDVDDNCRDIEEIRGGNPSEVQMDDVDTMSCDDRKPKLELEEDTNTPQYIKRDDTAEVVVQEDKGSDNKTSPGETLPLKETILDVSTSTAN